VKKPFAIQLRFTISAARINLCITRRAHASVYASSSCRPFELASTGAAIVANPYEGIERWFEPGSELVVVSTTEQAIDTYRLTNRGGKGVINMKTTNKTGRVVGVLLVKEDSDVMIVSQNGKMIRIESSTIRQAGRSTQGVRLVNLEPEDKVAAASVIPESDVVPDDGQETLPVQ
jgi:DNA gyrase/topoisomerase IV subunit A